MKKLIALLLAASVMVGAFAGCSANTPSGPSDTSNTSGETNYLRLETGLNDTLSALKPLSAAGYTTTWCMLCSTLMKYQPETGEYVPALAEKCEVSPDGLTYTVTLGDHTFHDGTPITADDLSLIHI